MVHWNIAWCQIENMNGIDDNLLSTMAVRYTLWKVKMPVHKTMSLRILNDKHEVKNGKNTGSCWTSESKIERVSLLFWEDFRQEVIIDPTFAGWTGSHYPREKRLSLVCLAGMMEWRWRTALTWREARIIFDGWRERINLPCRSKIKDWKYRNCRHWTAY